MDDLPINEHLPEAGKVELINVCMASMAAAVLSALQTL